MSRTSFRRAVRLAAAVALALVLEPGAVRATEARVAALGARSDFFTDDSEIRRWYAGLADYRSLVDVSSGSFREDLTSRSDEGNRISGPACGIHADLDRAGRWGTAGFIFSDLHSAIDPGSLYRRELDGGVVALYARRCGRITAAVGYGRAAQDFDSGGALAATRRHMGAGLRTDLGAKAILDVAGEVRGIRQRFAVAPYETDSWAGFGLRGRAFIDLGGGLVLVPLLEFVHEDLQLVQDAGTETRLAGIDRDLVHAGVGLDFFPDPDRMLVFSAEWLDGADHTPEELPSAGDGGRLVDRAVALRLALESRLSPLLSARASVGWQTARSVDRGETEDRDYSLLAAGLSVAALRTALDLAVSNRPPATLTRLALFDRQGAVQTWLTASLRIGFGP